MSAQESAQSTESAQPSVAEKERAYDARQYVHEALCHRGRHAPAPCPSCPTGWGLVRALRALDGNPRDACGARLALHDATCVSGCGPESDHADRTQSKVAAALRKFHALRSPQESGATPGATPAAFADA